MLTKRALAACVSGALLLGFVALHQDSVHADHAYPATYTGNLTTANTDASGSGAIVFTTAGDGRAITSLEIQDVWWHLRGTTFCGVESYRVSSIQIQADHGFVHRVDSGRYAGTFFRGSFSMDGSTRKAQGQFQLAYGDDCTSPVLNWEATGRTASTAPATSLTLDRDLLYTRVLRDNSNPEIYRLTSFSETSTGATTYRVSTSVNLTNHGFPDMGGRWSPNGMQIVYSRWADGSYEIYVMDADCCSTPSRITNNPANDYGPVWSPDGTKIAFVSDRDGHPEIYVMNRDGTGLQRLTFGQDWDFEPAWSPDGSKIAFVKNPGETEHIYVMNRDGSGQRKLTTNSTVNFHPSWSLDGSKIAFVAVEDGNYEIFVMNADGSGRARLTNNTASDQFPAWSPDGKWIAFASDRAGNYDLWIMAPDGTQQIKITTSSDDEYDPQWQPLVTAPPPPPKFVPAIIGPTTPTQPTLLPSSPKPRPTPPSGTPSAATPAPTSSPGTAPRPGAPAVTPNGQYGAGANAIVVQGAGTAADVAAVVGRDSGRTVQAIWLLSGGRWQYYLPAFPGVDGGLIGFAAAVTSAIVVLA